MTRYRHVAWFFAALIGCGSEHAGPPAHLADPRLASADSNSLPNSAPDPVALMLEEPAPTPNLPAMADAVVLSSDLDGDETIDRDAAIGTLLPPFDPEAEARAREREALADFERQWPVHGVAFHFLAQVHAAPSSRSPVIGYLRRGSRFRAKERESGPGCAAGWHAIVGGGYVCRGGGFLLGHDPQSFEPSPAPPSLEDALPYPYAYVAKETAAQYWRVPTESEVEATNALLEAMQRESETAEEIPPTAEHETESWESTSEEDAAVENAAQSDEDPLPSYFRMRMFRGFYVSVDREEKDGERRFFRTVRGGYVDGSVLADARPTEMGGVVLGGAWVAPLGFVFRRGVHFLSRDPVSGMLSQAGEAIYSLPLPLEEEVIERRGSRYRIGRDGSILRESAMRIVEPIARPDGVAENERWVHVDLSSQTLVAYQGDQPIFATMTSTGRAGYETPTGTYRIASKHVSITMDDLESTEPYSIEDVPWTMFFDGSYALHGAFWHDSFGQVRSHGCVNLAPADARWLFFWTDPPLPPGWHGVTASGERPGTVVHITA